jgi:hypothetical protein
MQVKYYDILGEPYDNLFEGCLVDVVNNVHIVTIF